MGCLRLSTNASVVKAFLVMIALTVACHAHGEGIPHYTFVSFGRPGSICYGISADGTRQVGYSPILVQGQYQGHAVMWEGPEHVLTDLHPPGWAASYALCISANGNTQGGYCAVYNPDIHDAFVWHSSNTSATNLHPSGYLNSFTLTLSKDGSVAAGSAQATNGRDHAALWTPSGFLDLHPSGPGTSSEIFGLSGDGTLQAGEYDANGSGAGSRTCIWRGTPFDVLTLGYLYTYASGMSSDGDRVFGTENQDGPRVATLWRVSTGEFTHFYAAGFYHTFGNSISPSGRYQAGYGNWQYYSGTPHAMVWRGSTASMVDLHEFVPSSYSQSIAHGVDDRGDVVGEAYNPLTGSEAVMWVNNWSDLPNPIVPPYAKFVSNPWIAKDLITGHFNIYVQTQETLRKANGSIFIRLTAPGDSTSPPVNKTLTSFVSKGTSSQTWGFDLPARNIPRFKRPMHFTATVTVTENGTPSAPASKTLEVKTPVLVVRGIFNNGNETGEFEDYIANNGYQKYGETGTNYPTVFTVSYTPTTDVLQRNSDDLKTWIDLATRTALPTTYADSVDLVCHSKGGLVARMLLKRFPEYSARIRRLLLCQTPNTGAVSAYQAPLPQAVKAELLPTHNWIREFWPQEFYQEPENSTLIGLNLTTMPTGLSYYLIWTNSWLAYSNFTIIPNLYDWNSGDSLVLSWSHLGYEVVNHVDGNSEVGDRIRAFSVVNGIGQEPTAEIMLPYSHSDFLTSARVELLALLTAE